MLNIRDSGRLMIGADEESPSDASANRFARRFGQRADIFGGEGAENIIRQGQQNLLRREPRETLLRREPRETLLRREPRETLLRREPRETLFGREPRETLFGRRDRDEFDEPIIVGFYG